MSDKAPLNVKLEDTVPALAAGADGDQVIGEVPFDASVSDVSYTPEANITGDDTDTRTFELVNKGADGSGTTVVASLAMETGTDATAFDESEVTLSEVEGATDVSSGDVLVFVSTHAGDTGLADPGGKVQIELSRS